jgi:hypothetical protein
MCRIGYIGGVRDDLRYEPAPPALYPSLN